MKFRFGPEGKYEAMAAKVLDQSKARMVLLLVIDGKKGTGMSVRGRVAGGVPKPEQVRLLRAMAMAIEAGGVTADGFVIETNPEVAPIGVPAKGQA